MSNVQTNSDVSLESTSQVQMQDNIGVAVLPVRDATKLRGNRIKESFRPHATVRSCSKVQSLIICRVL